MIPYSRPKLSDFPHLPNESHSLNKQFSLNEFIAQYMYIQNVSKPF